MWAIFRGIDYIIVIDLQMADGCFPLKRRVTHTVGAHHGVKHRYENIQDKDNICDKTSE